MGAMMRAEQLECALSAIREATKCAKLEAEVLRLSDCLAKAEARASMADVLVRDLAARLERVERLTRKRALEIDTSDWGDFGNGNDDDDDSPGDSDSCPVPKKLPRHYAEDARAAEVRAGRHDDDYASYGSYDSDDDSDDDSDEGDSCRDEPEPGPAAPRERTRVPRSAAGLDE